MESNGVFKLGEDYKEHLRLGILQSPSGRFLTAEIFNNEVNVSGAALRRRQIWSLIVESGQPDVVYLQSHLGRFLSADKDGKVNGASKYPGTDERFLLEFSPQTTGEWAFRSAAHGFYLSGSDSQVTCFSKAPVWWVIRLAIHPQVHLFHQLRSRYARLLPGNAELRTDQAHPCGAETLIWLEQPPMTSDAGRTGAIGRAACGRLGRVALRTETGLYLKPDGSLIEEMNDSVLFAIELRPGTPRTYAFRDSTGAYLAAVGPGTLKVKSNVSACPAKDELFLIDRASLQVAVLASNNKYASIRQGSEISANQHELDETAIFQLEYVGGKGFNCTDAVSPSSPLPQAASGDSETPDPIAPISNGLTAGLYCLTTGYWRLRFNNGNLWRISPSSIVQNVGKNGDPDTLFELLSLSNEATDRPGQVVFKSSSKGEALCAKKLGAVSSSGRQISQTDAPPATDIFDVLLVNRPTVALLSFLTGGFVSRGKQTLLDCSGANYERFELCLTARHTYQFRSRLPNNRLAIVTACPDGCVHLKPTPDQPRNNTEDQPLEPGTEFVIYFLGNGRCLLRVVGPHANDSFALVRSESKGEVKWGATTEIGVSHIWEL